MKTNMSQFEILVERVGDLRGRLDVVVTSDLLDDPANLGRLQEWGIFARSFREALVLVQKQVNKHSDFSERLSLCESLSEIRLDFHEEAKRIAWQ